MDSSQALELQFSTIICISLIVLNGQMAFKHGLVFNINNDKHRQTVCNAICIFAAFFGLGFALAEQIGTASARNACVFILHVCIKYGSLG
jgi:hypothetical protein